MYNSFHVTIKLCFFPCYLCTYKPWDCMEFGRLSVASACRYRTGYYAVNTALVVVYVTYIRNNNYHTRYNIIIINSFPIGIIRPRGAVHTRYVPEFTSFSAGSVVSGRNGNGDGMGGRKLKRRRLDERLIIGFLSGYNLYARWPRANMRAD